VEVWPNPVGDVLNVRILWRVDVGGGDTNNGDGGALVLSLADVLGREVYWFEGKMDRKFEHSINTRRLAIGQYFLKIITAEIVKVESVVIK
jgi:hypothetical protein